MVSALQLRANRANARRSTGPKSRAGKALAARNAYRHGLTRSLWVVPHLAADAEALAEVLAPAANAERKSLARQAAAAHIDLDRIRRARHRLIVQEFPNPDPLPRTKAGRIEHFEGILRLEELFDTGQYVPWHLRRLLHTPDAAERYALTIRNLARQLAIFERYERRAWSKRNKAFERLYTEQCLTQRRSDYDIKIGGTNPDWQNEPI
jgi:hypothetical protein